MKSSRPPKSPRQARLEALARQAWPGQSLEVVAPDEGAVHVWDDHGHVLLHVVHPLADEALGALARLLGSMTIGAAVDATEYVLRQHAKTVAIEFDIGVKLLTVHEGVVATGSSLRDAISNLQLRGDRDPRDSDELALPVSTQAVAAKISAGQPTGLREILPGPKGLK